MYLHGTEDIKTSIYVCACSGDHTVKIIDCQTGRCLKVLSGHRRTPWVVGLLSILFLLL